jgi:hypothetical protein
MKFGRRGRGGMSTQEYEDLHGNNAVNNKPNFSENRNYYRSIGWGVDKPNLVNLPALSEKLKEQFERRASLERENKSQINSPMKVLTQNFSEITSPVKSLEGSQERRAFVKQIDREYTSTGASGFLKLNGLFSNHVDKKLHVNPDLYHSMNMMSQKRTILNKLRKSIAHTGSASK